MTNEQTAKYLALREAVERADQLTAVQARYLKSQELLIEQLTARIRRLESELSELRCGP
jgi:hypothetical protein